MLRKKARESTFYKLHLDSVGKEVMTRESVPLFPVAHSNADSFQSAYVNVFVIGVCRIVTSTLRLWQGQKSRYIQQSRDFGVFEIVRNVKWRVIVTEKSQDAPPRESS